VQNLSFAQQHAEDVHFIHPSSLRLKCKMCCTDSSLVNVAEDTIGHLEMCVNLSDIVLLCDG